jgi:hypothetical protein
MINDFLRSGNSFKRMMPVKRRRALLASNPLRNSRPELIADDGQDVYFPVRPIAWPGPEPGSGTPAQVYKK